MGKPDTPWQHLVAFIHRVHDTVIRNRDFMREVVTRCNLSSGGCCLWCCFTAPTVFGRALCICAGACCSVLWEWRRCCWWSCLPSMPASPAKQHSRGLNAMRWPSNIPLRMIQVGCNSVGITCMPCALGCSRKSMLKS